MDQRGKTPDRQKKKKIPAEEMDVRLLCLFYIVLVAVSATG
jgi:hypothetical protein